MLETIRIQNFKSLRDVTLNLKQINLLIGPNNSGKSNFLKALEFYSDPLKNQNINSEELINLSFNRKEIFITKNGGLNNNPMSFTFVEDGNFLNRIELYSIEEYSMLSGILKDNSRKLLNKMFDFNEIEKSMYSYVFKAVRNTFHLFSNEKLKNTELKDILFSKNLKMSSSLYKASSEGPFELAEVSYNINNFFNDCYVNYGFYNIGLFFNNLKVYKPDPNFILKPYPITGDGYVNHNASNLVSFLDRMKDINIEVIDAINKDLRECIHEFKDIRLDTIKQNDSEFGQLKKLYNRDTFKKFGVSDHKGNIFWADELSEGALYFIALLAIIHQPNPPKLLLLEEPEKGIHPRRIAEIIRYIQRLADEKDIQVIMTTHSPLVLDEFAHDPESIFVFDKENGETVVRNLQRDIIDKNNAVLKEKGISPIDYEENLSENWLMGLLNGVPND